MEKTDGRKLSQETILKIKYTAIRLCKSGKNFSDVARILNVHNTSVGKWWKQYKEYGSKGLTVKKRGVSAWVNCKLNSKQMKQLKDILIKNTPDKLGLEFSLWTRQAIQSLIYKMWKIKVCLVTIGRYMKKLGFTPQKPIKRAYEQNPKAVEKWLNKTYPIIVEVAKKEGAEIHWLDETGISSYSNYLRGYAPKSKTPSFKMKSKRMNLNIISSISKLGKMRFMTYKNSLNTKIFIEFIKRLCKSIDKKIFVIMDNLAVHHSKKFISWIKKEEDKIEVFYLPPYSPELNSDERLNRDLKTHFHSGAIVNNKKEFNKKVTSFLKRVQRLPNRIKNYFTSEDLKYAA